VRIEIVVANRFAVGDEAPAISMARAALIISSDPILRAAPAEMHAYGVTRTICSSFLNTA
jgi:hypothetical protein